MAASVFKQGKVKKKISITDIAQQLNVSITTVSFILNGKAEEKRISKALSEKVLKLVEELNYKPNQLAKSLRTGKTNLIGLIVEDIANTFFANIARLIEEVAYQKGYRIIYCSTENDTKKTKDLIGMFRERHVDGYIITPTIGIEEDINQLIKDKLPFILFDRYVPGVPTNYVGIDNFGSSYQAARHLLSQGFEKIAFVTLESEQTQMQERLEGYEKALALNNKTCLIEKVQFTETSDLMVAHISAFLRVNPDVDAVIFATNYLGIAGLEAIKKLNLKIPAQIGVIAFDDHDLFRLYSPSITSIRQPVADIAEHLLKILLKNLDNALPDKNAKVESVVLSPSLIIRESSQRHEMQLTPEIERL